MGGCWPSVAGDRFVFLYLGNALLILLLFPIKNINLSLAATLFQTQDIKNYLATAIPTFIFFSFFLFLLPMENNGWAVAES